MARRDVPRVLAEFDTCYVIYKPSYWKCELQDPSDTKPSFITWIRSNLKVDEELFDIKVNPSESGDTGFGPLCHRLDRETSGPMLVAKTIKGRNAIRSQFHKCEVVKRYVCLVHGHVKPSAGRIEKPIRTIRNAQTTYSEVSGLGMEALTRYKVMAHYTKNAEPYSLVMCDILTGRTHQIRVHMDSIGHPLVCDDKYPRASTRPMLKDDERLFLHCFYLEFLSKKGEKTKIAMPLPKELKKMMKSLHVVACFHHEFFEVLKIPIEDKAAKTLVASPSAPSFLVLLTVLEENGQMQLNELNELPEIKAVLGEGMNVSWEWSRQYADHLLSFVQGRNDWTVELVIHTLRRQKEAAVAKEDFDEAAALKQREMEATKELAKYRQMSRTHHPNRAAEELVMDTRANAAAFPSIYQAGSVSAGKAQKEPKRVSLTETLTNFLMKKTDTMAHINEVNNDLSMRAAIKANGMQAIKKQWLTEKSDVFALVRDADNEMYVALAKHMKIAPKEETKKAGTTCGPAVPYARIKQEIRNNEGRCAKSQYVYEYGETSATSENQKPENSNLTKWETAFLKALCELGGGSVPVEELMEKVPDFIKVLPGKTGPREACALLVSFLEKRKDVFQVRKTEGEQGTKWLVSRVLK